jgi:GDP-L-fucose synthase
MEKGSKIYIAGHKGMVGSAITTNLQTKGYSNLLFKNSKELDLTCQEKVGSFFEKERPDYVFIAAAKVGGIQANNTYRAEFIYQNMMIESNIIHAAYKNNVKKLVFLGSSCIYPRMAPQPLKEEYLLTGLLEYTNEPYAIAKIAGIKLCEAYYDQYGCNFISVMPTNLYGPNDNYNPDNSHVLPALIRKIHLAKCLENNRYDLIIQDLSQRPFNNSEKITSNADVLEFLRKLGIVMSEQGVSLCIWGTGKPFREFLHVDDMADACVFLMENYNEKQFVNIGTGKDLTIKDLSIIIKNIVGFKGEICFDSSKPDGTPKKLLDVSKLESLGWKYKISLNEGIESVYKNYILNS